MSVQPDPVRQSPLRQPGIFHPYSMLAHTFSKSALTPGQRLGYLALAPGLPQAEAMRTTLFHVLLSSGLAMPDAVMQVPGS
jgi:aspartate aminotransferase